MISACRSTRQGRSFLSDCSGLSTSRDGSVVGAESIRKSAVRSSSAARPASSCLSSDRGRRQSRKGRSCGVLRSPGRSNRPKRASHTTLRMPRATRLFFGCDIWESRSKTRRVGASKTRGECAWNLKSIAEGRTDSVRPDHSPATGPDLRLTVLIEAKPSAVFGAFADPTQLDHWSTGGLPRGTATVEPRPGGTYSFGWNAGPIHVTEWKTDQHIALRWSRHTSGLVIKFDFEEKASGTAIYFSLTGFAEQDGHDIVRQRGRWSELFVCLKNFIESGSSGFLNPYEDQVRKA